MNGEYNGCVFNKFKYLFYRIKTSINLRINNISKNSIYPEQVLYNSVKNILNPIMKKYDMAVAYSQGFPTYFISDKVSSNKKLAWINCNYVKSKYDKDLDNKYYNKIDKFIVVSKFIYDSISKMKYGYKNKMKIIFDIIDPNLIEQMSLDSVYEIEQLNDKETFTILTVGSLVEAKGYDLLIKAANLLKLNKFDFKWFIIGEGEERDKIKKLISRHNLEKQVFFLGSKSNPYKYMRLCDLYVQTSIREGFGLTVMEAKILKKVIVSTNFDTINELITNKVDGIVVEKNENDIYKAISELMTNLNYYNSIKTNLKKIMPYNSVSEINKFYDEFK
ncbi:glycosyltransferase [Clostridium perfringens]|uniref:glycosyltransferase n=1 Tax=Clostridium perfringens TaxID=1502 RepID=UPI003D355B09